MEQQIDVDFSNKIIFSDEAHFHLDGFDKIVAFEVQKIHVWLFRNKCTHNVSLFGADFVLEASSGIIGQFFFENAAGQAIIVNGDRYGDMIIQFFVSKFQDMDVDDVWFQ